jgi:hypothetical protein
MGDLLLALVGGGFAVFSLHYFYDIVEKAALVMGAGVGFLIWVGFRLNKA